METALISATVSFIIFTATQWISGIRARSDLLRSKLEELCRIVSSLGPKLESLCSEIALPETPAERREHMAGILSEAARDLHNLRMLTILYFPLLMHHAQLVAEAFNSGSGIRIWYDSDSRGNTTKDYSPHPSIAQKGLSQLNRRTRDMFNFISAEHKTLIETPWTVALAFFKKCC